MSALSAISAPQCLHCIERRTERGSAGVAPAFELLLSTRFHQCGDVFTTEAQSRGEEHASPDALDAGAPRSGAPSLHGRPTASSASLWALCLCGPDSNEYVTVRAKHSPCLPAGSSTASH